MSSQRGAKAGQAVYSKAVLSIYDLWVLGLSNRFIWKCPTPRLLASFNRNVTGNHLDVGVGSGYFLDHCVFPTDTPRLALMDLNLNSLETASKRALRYAPESFQRNVLEPIVFDEESFDSISINYLLHCLPGTMETKSVIFDHLAELMKPGAVIFGATLLQGDVKRSALARQLMKVYNSKGIFSNEQDTVEALQHNLARRFEIHSIEVVGCAGLFRAQKTDD
jgi:2-polyprenyl-3-methyl-5-hydroxy-6-metoxy-1,4-benzoquinol methylase